jgi:hypothetical protein
MNTIKIMPSRRAFATLALLSMCFIAFLPLSARASEQNGDGSKIATTTKLKASATNVKASQKITLTATVAPSKANGTVTFYGRPAPSKPFVKITKVTVSGGVAKLTGKIGIVGTIGFKAEYSGSSTFKPSTSAIVTVVSQK